MMCEERTAVSFFGVAVFFFVWWDEPHRLLFSILYCGGWNEPYARGGGGGGGGGGRAGGGGGGAGEKEKK